MPKKAKPVVKAKSTVGSTKKPMNKTKTLMLSACAALLLLSTAYAGVTYLQQRSLRAKAAGYSWIGYAYGTGVRACYIPSSGYRVSFSNGSGVPVYGRIGPSFTNIVRAYSSVNAGYYYTGSYATYVNGIFVGSIGPNISRC